MIINIELVAVKFTNACHSMNIIYYDCVPIYNVLCLCAYILYYNSDNDNSYYYKI